MISLTNEDCIALMKRYPDKYFDLAIVDPPYGIGFSHYVRSGHNAGHQTRKRHVKDGKKKWDTETPGDEYFAELFRVSKDQIIWGGNYFKQLTGEDQSPNLKTKEQFDEYMAASPHNWLFWWKKNPVPNFADGELAWCSFAPDPAIFDFTYYGNVCGKTSAPKKHHPTQKPVELYRFCLHNFAKEGFKILDTHLGSGTHGVASIDYGFDLTACEIDVNYYNGSLKLIHERQNQLTLF